MDKVISMRCCFVSLHHHRDRHHRPGEVSVFWAPQVTPRPSNSLKRHLHESHSDSFKSIQAYIVCLCRCHLESCDSRLRNETPNRAGRRDASFWFAFVDRSAVRSAVWAALQAGVVGGGTCLGLGDSDPSLAAARYCAVVASPEKVRR